MTTQYQEISVEVHGVAIMLATHCVLEISLVAVVQRMIGRVSRRTPPSKKDQFPGSVLRMEAETLKRCSVARPGYRICTKNCSQSHERSVGYAKKWRE
ncbi:hypothetical protein BDZ45DRAFT_808218 [Acephala macrosclerotiorum]|nr:hypothetical protein BDZ45DRAFT_808218 [Acephala macrosclerotiorum]